MSSKYSKLITLFGVLMLAFSACRKSDYRSSVETTVAVANSTDKSRLNSLFASLRSLPTTLLVQAGTYQVVRAPQGTKFTFYPNSFRDKSGRTITNGTVQLQVVEMYRPGAMIANRATTADNGRLLKSGGQVFVTASMNGVPVFVNKYGLGFLAPQPGQQVMELFYGNTSNVDSLANWPIAVDSKGSICFTTSVDTMSLYIIDTSGTIIDTTSIYRSYNQFDSVSSLTWINCDYYADSTGQHTNIKVSPTDTTFNASNTEVFIVAPAINALSAVSNYDPITHSFSLYSGYEMPTGLTVSIIVIGNKGGNLYYFEQDGITLTPNMTFSPLLVPRTFSYIHDALSVL